MELNQLTAVVTYTKPKENAPICKYKVCVVDNTVDEDNFTRRDDKTVVTSLKLGKEYRFYVQATYGEKESMSSTKTVKTSKLLFSSFDRNQNK